MTKEEIIQQKKNEALNKIRKLYHPKFKYPYDEYADMSKSEQKERDIERIIETLEKEINNIKNNFNKFTENE